MKTLLKNFKAVNEGHIFEGLILINNGLIEKIYPSSEGKSDIMEKDLQIIDLQGNFLLPGVIDDQVHFRDPGLTHKGDLYTEARAAVAGGVTSFMDMPNTLPACTTNELLEEKYRLASEKSLANYSFFLGGSNDNISEIRKVDIQNVCGVKIFMGSSTGNLLVNEEKSLEAIFAESPTIIAAHCEDDAVIKQNADLYRSRYGENIAVQYHAKIRNDEACFRSSSKAVQLARKYNSRFHLIHVSTARELQLLDNTIPLKDKRITSEVCVHHLWFNESDYPVKGNLIKWNPSIKSELDRQSLFKAVLDDHIDIIATDHAPHTLEEKAQSYFKAPSGAPMIQHSLVVMLEFYHQGIISLEKIVDKMSHSPAILFNIEKRGFLREGYHADLTVVDLNATWKVNKSNILYKCGWSPLEGTTLRSEVVQTFVNGKLVYDYGKFDESVKGQRLKFER
ncbi:MAG: dihydroorotase [Bacteroidales bacterium]